MGNVQSITRYGLRDNSQYGLIDNVSLYYIGNQVVHADDAVTGPNYAGAFHFRDSNGTQWDTEYEYDKNGRLTRDRNKGILQIQYNLLNLPSKTTFSDGGSINYQYSASGMKQMVWGSAPGQGSKSQFYLGNYVYSNGVKQLLVDGGYVTFSGATPQYHFYVKDHLGNNRMVVNASGTVEQVSHYYAFGGLMGENTGSDVQDFKYNGKELDRLHGLDWYDYNARHMDAVRGVFTTMDPLCEKYYNISPYAYCGNNPVLFIDPTGMEPDSLESALMAAYSYHDSKRSSYAKQLRDRGWKVVNNFKSKTGFKATLFSKTTEMDGDMQSEYAFAFAGTDFKINSLNGMLDAAKDIAADIQNYLGVGLSLQQAQAAVCALAFSLKYDNLTFVGHSLGGGLAAFASMITGNAAITFNPASLNGTAKQIGNLFGGEGNITQYRTVGNPLFNSPIRVGGDYINQFQSITGHPSQGNVHPVYINSHNFNHNIETFVTLFGGQ